MTSLLVQFLILGLLAQPHMPRLQYAVPPVPPPNSASTAVVVMNLDTDARGSVASASVLAGAQPFVDASLSALRNWQFVPSSNSEKQAPVSVTILYRAR